MRVIAIKKIRTHKQRVCHLCNNIIADNTDCYKVAIRIYKGLKAKHICLNCRKDV